MIHTTVQLQCDDCPAVSRVLRNTTGTEARRHFEHTDGWSRMNGKDRCRDCTGKRLENPLSRAGRLNAINR